MLVPIYGWHFCYLEPWLLFSVLKIMELNHRIYWKPSHTDHYLYHDSNHHPRQNHSLIKVMIVNQGLCICEPQHLHKELAHLEVVLQANGYPVSEKRRVLRSHWSGQSDVSEEQQVIGKAFLPYVRNVMDHIGAMWGLYCFLADTEDPTTPAFGERR